MLRVIDGFVWIFLQVIADLLSSYMEMMTETSQFASWKIDRGEESDHHLVEFLLKDIINPGKDKHHSKLSLAHVALIFLVITDNLMNWLALI